MSHYRTQSIDTSVEADRLQFDLLRTLAPEQCVQRVWEANEWARSRALIGLRRHFPDAGERELELRFAALKYGRDTVLQFSGWDPDGASPPDGTA